jgi:hypothetical protein
VLVLSVALFVVAINGMDSVFGSSVSTFLCVQSFVIPLGFTLFQQRIGANSLSS